jgi:hypothetical protein
MMDAKYRATLLLLGLLALLGMLPLAAAAQVEEARVQIDGMV